MSHHLPSPTECPDDPGNVGMRKGGKTGQREAQGLLWGRETGGRRVHVTGFRSRDPERGSGRVRTDLVLSQTPHVPEQRDSCRIPQEEGEPRNGVWEGGRVLVTRSDRCKWATPETGSGVRTQDEVNTPTKLLRSFSKHYPFHKIKKNFNKGRLTTIIFMSLLCCLL